MEWRCTFFVGSDLFVPTFSYRMLYSPQNHREPLPCHLIDYYRPLDGKSLDFHPFFIISRSHNSFLMIQYILLVSIRRWLTVERHLIRHFPVATFDSICFSALQRIPICPINITDTKIVNGSGY